MILTEMIVIDPQNRSSASYLLQTYFPENLEVNDSNLLRWCLFGYLKLRDHSGEYFLILLCAHIDYYRLDSKIR